MSDDAYVDDVVYRLQHVKRTTDYVIASVLLVVFSVPMLIIAIAIRIDSHGPVLFRQPRIGLNGETFLILKFRTMVHHNEPASVDGSRQAIRLDPRITRLGRWLRRYSIDEMPQLLNVLRGEMSLVGPRPHPINMPIHGVNNYHARHRVLPGITGWAQVNGWRGETVHKEQIVQRLAHDLYYIDNWSFTLDIRILMLTVTRELFSKKAF